MKPHHRIAAAAGLAACFAAAPGSLCRSAESDAVTPALARIQAAAAAHPEDPDLAWVLARQLAREGRGQAAVDTTRRFLASWPDRRPEARIEIARSLLECGAAAEAEALLDEEVRTTPSSGTAHFYRGMAMRASHAPDAANREFQAAALLEPALRSETLLVRALLAFDRGRDEEAVSLLQELLRIDPTSDTAVRARLLLRDHEVAHGSQRLRADALAGFEWDQNVTLEGAESETDPSDREDFRGVWGIGLSGQPLLAERAGLLLGYRYDQTQQVELEDFNMIQNALFASLSLQPSEALKNRLALRLDSQAYDTLQNFDHALAGGSIRPNLLWAFGPRAGVLRLFGTFEFAQFDQHPFISAQERDSVSGGLGIEQLVPLPPRGASIAVSASWLRSITEAEPDGTAVSFDGDFDYDSFRLRAVGRAVLPGEIQVQVDAVYSHDRYLNDNYTPWLNTLESEPREDDIVAGRIALTRAIARFTRLELYWRGAWRSSNVGPFDYDKQIVGLLVHVASDW